MVEDDELQDDQLDGDDGQEDSGSGSDNSAPPSGGSADDKGQQRVNDLMSKWQAEQARANRLAAELERARGGAGGSAGGDQQGEADNSRISEFEEFARESARQTLFNSDPRLAEYGLKTEDLAGTTLAEMRKSMEKHQKLIGGIETRARNRILAEHGLDPDVATGAGTESGPAFSKMTDAEFEKFLQERDGRSR